ncbi:major facilitator superfamily domain-containing protein [Microdochium trichocladiopsis]|uniref:Major facilitator superfamily domain-containing protein n=1 Tax=Microdochium trichocladiopsis TaxID=1682393 RepID=A0A9P8XYW5_9PEZI|nr:major facilitator superfamily domain-containing protein [Microdochium trichocladiopsis]KAH7026250.1 major facilitator superfamily domain-containing protein [Microdochium trichocladiopsis]
MRLARDGSWTGHPGASEDLQEISLLDNAQQLPCPKQSRSDRPQCLKNTIHEIFFVACLALTAASPVFLQRSTVVVTASIANELRMSPAELAWATAGSGLTTGAFLLPFGHISDRCSAISRKSLLMISLLAFSLLAGATSFATNGITLDILSGLAGVACAANIPIAVGILSLAYSVPSRRKNMAFSSFLTGTPAATIIGGLGSGGLAQKLSWKAPFVCLAVLYAAITETITETPMIPQSVWADLCVVLVTTCTLFASMTYYSQLFWISMFLQQLDHLAPFDVALRLLPQAFVGLLLSPLVGLVLHRMAGSTLLLAAVSCLALSNIPLIFLRQGSNYFAWVFPSLVMSTIGMDWTLNIGSLHALSRLPLYHHSAGASLLQAAARMGIPFGIATTTAIWSSYDGRGHEDRLLVAYSNTFIATASLAGVCLLIAPFMRIGRLGSDQREEIESDTESVKPDSTTFVGGAPIQNNSFRPSKRWSIGETISATSSFLSDNPRRAPSLTMSLVSSQKSIITPKTDNSSVKTMVPRNHAPVVWVVCEDCGTRKRERSTEKAGDPARYFNDISDPANRSHPGRRRFPVASRQAMTHQMLTKGFQPYKDQP